MKRLPLLLSAIVSSTLLNGCSTSFSPRAADPLTSTAAIQGRAQGGQQPITGMKIYLYAAGTGGYGTASQSLLTSGYVTTDSNGFFSVTGGYTCPAGGTSYLYLYGVGGNTGAGNNSAATLMAPLGACAAGGNLAAAVPYVWMNEVTTVVTAYSLAGWMSTPLTLATDNTTLAQNGLATAFTTATQLEDLSTGTALLNNSGLGLASTPSTGTSPQSTVNSLANILAACVNSAGASSTACAGLFTNARNSSNVAPTDTAAAILNIAHTLPNRYTTATALFNLSSSAAPFQPALSTAPNDWTLSRQLNVAYAPALPAAAVIASDGAGNLGLLQSQDGRGLAFVYNAAGIAKGGGFGGLDFFGLAINPNSTSFTYGDGFNGSNTYYQAKADGGAEGSCSQFTTFGPNGVTFGQFPSARDLQFDSAGGLWISGANNLYRLAGGASSSASCNSPKVVSGLSSPSAIAADASGNVWVANSGANNLVKSTSSGTLTTYTDPAYAGIAHVAVGSMGEVIASAAGSPFLVTLSPGSTTPTYECNGGAKQALAIDGANTRWMVTAYNELEHCPAFTSESATVYPPLPTDAGVRSITIDGAGNVWVLGSTVTEVIGAATPPVLPLSAAAATNKIATRP